MGDDGVFGNAESRGRRNGVPASDSGDLSSTFRLGRAPVAPAPCLLSTFELCGSVGVVGVRAMALFA